MNVLIASPEVHPFVRTGGLADVTGALPKILNRLGHDVRVILPKHKGIEELGFPMKYRNYKISCPVSQSSVHAEIVETMYDGVTAYLVENDEYYYRDYLYSTPDGDYLDNAERFIFFSKSILEAIKVVGFMPEVLHCNDWETALAPLFLKTLYRDDPQLKGLATLLTIHNIGYQGVFWHHDMHLLNIGWEYFTPDCLEFFGKINFLKGGIVSSDVLNTVSKQYREEILTPEFGYGLDGILRSRKQDFYGIVNGADYDAWSSEKDPLIPARYSMDDVSNKAVCKETLQAEFGLPANKDIPLIATISRLSDQKGFDLISVALEEMVALGGGLQYVVLGTGERRYHDLLGDFAKRLPQAFSVKMVHDNRLAHLMVAGADMLLAPSRYEPCGLSQLYSLRYGTVPIVRGVGGLEDTITDSTAQPGVGTGFKFYDYSKVALFDAIQRALAVYQNNDAWLQLMRRCMAEDFSWERSAREYAQLYNKATKKHETR